VRSLICCISNEYDKIKCFKKSVVGYIFGWIPEFFSCLGYIVGCGYPTRTHTHTRGNSVAHVCIHLTSLLTKKIYIMCFFINFFSKLKFFFFRMKNNIKFNKKKYDISLIIFDFNYFYSLFSFSIIKNRIFKKIWNLKYVDFKSNTFKC